MVETLGSAAEPDGEGVGRFYAHNALAVDDQRAAILRSCLDYRERLRAVD
jgi:hypothetical protein